MKTRSKASLTKTMKRILFSGITGFVCVLLIMLYFSNQNTQKNQVDEKSFVQNYESYSRLLFNYEKPLSFKDFKQATNKLLKLYKEDASIKINQK